MSILILPGLKSGAIKSVMTDGIFYLNNEDEFEYGVHLKVICTKINYIKKSLTPRDEPKDHACLR